MRISSSQNQVKLQGHAFERQFPVRPVDGFTETARLDQELASGITDSVEASSERQRKLDRDYSLLKFAKGALIGGLGGFALGQSIVGAPAVAGPVGAAVGIYIAWNSTLRASTGEVKISRDGNTRTTKFHKNPTSYRKTAQEWRAELKLDGRLGDQIKAASVGELPKADPTEFQASRRELGELANERKLLADLGQKSRYGYQVLNLVNSDTARRLVSAERPVFAVAGESHDEEHEYSVSASNHGSTEMLLKEGVSVDRTYDYQLKAIKTPQDLEELPQGEGLPEGFNGVYRNLNSATLSVGHDEQQAALQVSKNRTHTSQNARRVQRDANLDLGSERKFSISTFKTLNGARTGMLLGAGAALIATETFLPGSSALFGNIVLGGIIGYEAGRLTQGHLPPFHF